MKVNPEQYATLRDAMAEIAKIADLAGFRAKLESEGKSKDPAMRVRWDWLHATHRAETNGHNRLLKPLYDAGCTDAHIDTALKAIARELGIGAAL